MVQNIIDPAQNKRLITIEGNTRDIIRVIMMADQLSNKFIDTRNVRQLKGRNDFATLENIYDFVKYNTRYNTDPRGQQNVRLPGYLFETGVGDCKSYSVAIAALCRALGLPYRYRFIRQSGAHNYHHVYIVAGTPDGSARGPVVLDAVHRRFNTEPAYVQKLDLKPGQRIPTGIGSLSNVGSGAWLIILLITALFAFKK